MINRYFYFNFLRRAYIFTVRQIKKILGLNDSPHSIAMGVAIGTFVAFTPTIPLQMTIAFFVAWACRVNKAASLPPAWLTNPITAPPIFFAEYLTGVYMLKLVGYHAEMIDQAKFKSGFQQILDLQLSHPIELYHQIAAIMVKTWDKIGIPLLLGSLVWSTIFAIIFYFLTSKVIQRHHERKQARIKTRQPTPSA